MAEEDGEGSVSQELQVLESIYLDELQVFHGERLDLHITLHPATAHDADSQYVRLTLQLSLPPQYPAEPPAISVSNARGLCDDQILSILSALKALAARDVGLPILYELIEKGKEMLTSSNIPHGHCVICLYDFQKGDALTKTSCFHHFHSFCLSRFADHCQKSSNNQEFILCPVCRESLTCDLYKLQAAPPPQHPEVVYVPDSRTRQREEEMQRLYHRQLEKGGIIDTEAENKRFFISIQELPSDLMPETDPSPQSAEAPTIPCKPHSEQRSGFRNRPLRSDNHGFHHLQANREQLWRRGARSERNQSQCASHRGGRPETKPSVTRDQGIPETGSGRNNGSQSFRPPCSRENNI
ncbi:E3 ubiquitin-protein ligase RNF25 [Pelodytes ibericus]